MLKTEYYSDNPYTKIKDVEKALKELNKFLVEDRYDLQAIVDFARNPETELHQYYEWDSKRTHNEYLLQQTRRIIKACKYRNLKIDPVTGFVTVVSQGRVIEPVRKSGRVEKDKVGLYTNVKNLEEQSPKELLKVKRDLLHGFIRTCQNRLSEIVEIAERYKLDSKKEVLLLQEIEKYLD